MTQKTRRSQDFCAGVEAAETDAQLNPSQEDIKSEKNKGRYFGVGSEKGSYSRCDLVKTKQADKHVRTTTKTRKNF